MSQFRQAEFTPEQQEWIASQDAISREESQTMAIESLAAAVEAQTEAILAQTRMMELLMMQVSRTADAIEEQPSLADQRCDFTGWNLTEAISNLVAVNEKK